LTISVEPYRILFVCTANICRSPAAETLARSRFGEREAIFRSAGFLDEGRECPPLMIQALQEKGVDATAHRSYQLDEASLEAADLVLTMEGEHVKRATLLQPDAFDKIVALREAADLLSSSRVPMSLPEFIVSLNRERNPSTYLSARWDVSDPFGRKLKDYRRAVEEISELVQAVIGRLS